MSITRVVRAVSVRLIAAVAVAVAALAPVGAAAQAYPSKLVRIIVPYPPGGTNDILGRYAAERLSERWKAQVIVENRPGATGNIGTDLVAKSAPDGHTLLVMPLDIAIIPALYSNLPYDVRRDLTPITAMAFSGLVITASPSSGIGSMRELIERAKAEPGKLSYGSCGNGTPHHLAFEMLKVRSSINLTHVPYKGCAQAQTAALAGEVAISINAVGNVASLIKAGRLKGLAVTSTAKDRELPDVPTLQDSGFANFEVLNWFALFGPANMPRDIVTKIYEDLKAEFSTPALVKRLNDRSLEPYLDAPDHFRKMLLDDVERFGPVAKQLGLKLD